MTEPRSTVTRWEEQLRARTETVVTGRVRVRKRLVTEERTIVVPVVREEVLIDYEEVPDLAGAPAVDAAVSDDVLEVVRHEQRVVVTTEDVPVERIRVVRRVVTGEHVAQGPVRREVVEVDGTGIGSAASGYTPERTEH